MPDAILAVHPVLGARDVEESLRFYSKLGFACIFRDDPTAPRYAAVQRGPVELHLQWADPTQWAHGGDRPIFRFLAPDVDALYAEFRAADAIGQSESPWVAPANTPWGTREFHVRDPAGNILQFYWPLGGGSV